jgi:hypothetical protein
VHVAVPTGRRPDRRCRHGTHPEQPSELE